MSCLHNMSCTWGLTVLVQTYYSKDMLVVRVVHRTCSMQTGTRQLPAEAAGPADPTVPYCCIQAQYQVKNGTAGALTTFKGVEESAANALQASQAPPMHFHRDCQPASVLLPDRRVTDPPSLSGGSLASCLHTLLGAAPPSWTELCRKLETVVLNEPAGC